MDQTQRVDRILLGWMERSQAQDEKWFWKDFRADVRAAIDFLESAESVYPLWGWFSLSHVQVCISSSPQDYLGVHCHCVSERKTLYLVCGWAVICTKGAWWEAKWLTALHSGQCAPWLVNGLMNGRKTMVSTYIFTTLNFLVVIGPHICSSSYIART